MINFKKGTLPHWDEQFRFLAYAEKDPQGHQTFNPTAEHQIDPFHAAWSPIARQKRLGNLSIDDSLTIIAEALQDNQAYHILDPSGNNWRVQFPYARYINKGDPIRNLTTGETYTIGEVISEERKDVILTGTTYPKATDKLRLDEANEIRLSHGWPRSFAGSQKQDTSSVQVTQPSSLNDTITFLVKRSEPAGLGKTPFSSLAKVLSPRLRQTVKNPEDPDEVVTIEGYLFHSIVAFDCWARDNTRAADLLAYFEDFMFRCKWLFELYGLCKVFYWRRNEDQEVYRWRADITKRTVEYLVISERLFMSKSPRLRSLSVTVNITSNPDTFDPTEVLDDDTLFWPDPSSNIGVSIETYASSGT